MEYAVRFDSVIKYYSTGLVVRRRVTALQNVTFTIPYGSVVGLVGPNRSGKTTVLKILLSLCRPTSGYVERLGRHVSDIRTLTRVGYMHENHAFPYYLSAKEVLYLYGAMSGLKGVHLRRCVEAELARVGLVDRQDDLIQTYSKGMIQRLGLAQAMLTQPDLVVFDEPTEGLDIFGRQLLRQVISELRAAGKTVLLVSHSLVEIEQLCNHLIILVNGKIVYDGALDDLYKCQNSHQSFELILKSIYDRGTAA
ncbi:MAG: ABC transporter ATP-binding protein [Thermogemmata sp.]|nr:ABC transporter ATP-binding protein [Thermogemmata sp.]